MIVLGSARAERRALRAGAAAAHARSRSPTRARPPPRPPRAPYASAASAQPERGKESTTLRAPEDLESRIFLRDRPSGSVDLRQQRESALLESMLKQREKLVVVRRAQAIEQLERFVANEPEQSEYMADALLRLGELRWEEARVAYLGELEAWQRLPAETRARGAAARARAAARALRPDPDPPPRASIATTSCCT